MEQVRAALEPEEPNYSRAAALGPEALPFLEQLVHGPNPMLASKATYLASVIHPDQAVGLIARAAAHAHPVVRVAAAAAARNLAALVAGGVLRRLVEDHDRGVRQVALQSVHKDTTPEVRSAVAALSETEPDPAIRTLSRRTLDRLAPPADAFVAGTPERGVASSIRAAARGKVIGDLGVAPTAATPKIIGDLGKRPTKPRTRRKTPKKGRRA
jgi:hypothetical protein